jgi:uncharacterized protein (DUF1810 family)
MADPHNLQRFLDAQDPIWPAPIQELSRGHKTTHWMWFVFPQIAGLGRSATARHYALASRSEARAYLAHPVLGARLDQAIDAILSAHGDAEAILGSIDAVKLRSSMTLFAAVADEPGRFEAVLAHFFGGSRDPATIELLGDDE